GEGWSLDEQRDSLKQQAAKDKEAEKSKRDVAPPAAKPAVSIPTPFDFGGTDRDEIKDTIPRSMPPPLPPGTTKASVPPPPPRPSKRPPPLPRGSMPDGTGGSAKHPVSAPPGVAPSQAPPATTEGSNLVDLLSARVERLTSAEDDVGIARVHVELAIVHEML